MVHHLFDLLALIGAVLISRWFRQRHGLMQPPGILKPSQHHYYLLVLLLGLAIGSILFGTLNLYLSSRPGIAKSILGGIFGAIMAAEIFKYFAGIRRSTGLYFVPGLIVLIVVGRIGCFLAGLPDFTYGTETTLSWGVDFGDGVPRHPVQLYESFTMLAFLVVLLIDYRHRPQWWQRQGFYLFVLVYAGQRFIWEFLKPYPSIWAGLNLFHWICLLLLAYGSLMLKRSRCRAE